MGFGVFIHRSDSIYDDSPAERYQFPSQYLGRVQACVGDWIVYYEPRKVSGTRGYFAIAKVEKVSPDPSSAGMYLALMEPGSYLDFANPVPFSGAGWPNAALAPSTMASTAINLFVRDIIHPPCSVVLAFTYGFAAHVRGQACHRS